MIRGIR